MVGIALALASLLCTLAAFHVVWAIRGVGGDSVAIPKLAGRPVFVPSRGATWTVAAALSSGALLALLQGGVLRVALPAASVTWASRLAGAMFLLRAIGDFRLVGVFKRVRGTDFARWDDFGFVPLCVLIGVAFVYLAI